MFGGRGSVVSRGVSSVGNELICQGGGLGNYPDALAPGKSAWQAWMVQALRSIVVEWYLHRKDDGERGHQFLGKDIREEDGIEAAALATTFVGSTLSVW